jgi:hypothetical protein
MLQREDDQFSVDYLLARRQGVEIERKD